jgi:hypothetical protein
MPTPIGVTQGFNGANRGEMIASAILTFAIEAIEVAAIRYHHAEEKGEFPMQDKGLASVSQSFSPASHG